ncbi:MAG: hypothetical protein PVH50_11300 [Anaerolineae bacterium]|jgi:hypothetical protein
MSHERENGSENREYPPFWAKAVPVALTIIGIIIVVLVVIIVGVALGLFPSVL